MCAQDCRKTRSEFQLNYGKWIETFERFQFGIAKVLSIAKWIVWFETLAPVAYVWSVDFSIWIYLTSSAIHKHAANSNASKLSFSVMRICYRIHKCLRAASSATPNCRVSTLLRALRALVKIQTQMRQVLLHLKIVGLQTFDCQIELWTR